MSTLRQGLQKAPGDPDLLEPGETTVMPKDTRAPFEIGVLSLKEMAGAFVSMKKWSTMLSKSGTAILPE